MGNSQVMEISIRLQFVGQQLKLWRESAQLSQSKVAKALGYASSQFISNWERGIALPPMDVLPRLVELYNVAPHDLIETMGEYQAQMQAYQRDQLKALLTDRS